MRFLSILLLLTLFGCAPSITVYQLPDVNPSILGIWEHDSNPVSIEFEPGSYTVSYQSLTGYGEWRYMEGLPNTIRVRDTLCKMNVWGEYHIFFTKTGIYLSGNDMECRGRLDRWGGYWTAILIDTGIEE